MMDFITIMNKQVWYKNKNITKFVVRTIIERSSTDTPIFVIYDDAISEKTKSSSKKIN